MTEPPHKIPAVPKTQAPPWTERLSDKNRPDTAIAEDVSITMDAGTENDGATAEDTGSADDTSTTMDAG